MSPLRDAPLRILECTWTPISDLSPLASCTTLRELRIGDTKVADLHPLAKLRLERLAAYNTAVSDVAPLAGMPLKLLLLDRTKVRDLRPLLECPDLEEATIPDTAENVEVLRHHPKLKRLSYQWDILLDAPAQTTAEFWAEYDAKKALEKK